RTEPLRDWYLLGVASQSELPPLPELSLLDHAGSAALREAGPPLADPAYELWEPERVFRQLAIYESAMAAELQTGQEARQQLEHAMRELEAARQREAALRAELDEITASRAWRAVTRYRRVRMSLRRRSGAGA